MLRESYATPNFYSDLSRAEFSSPHIGINAVGEVILLKV